MAAYIDSSAIVKLVVREAESAALRRFLRAHEVRVASALARVEVVRAVHAHGDSATERARAVLERMALLAVSDDVLDRAGSLDGTILRSLDAIHVATAMQLGADLAALVTYDDRMGDAGRALGLRVESPR